MLKFKSFGGVALCGRDGQVVRLRSRKHLALLLYLASNRRRIFTRDDLARLLWTTSIDRARHSLSQALYDLRRHLGQAVVRGTGDHVSLDTSTLDFDAHLFEEAVKAGNLARAVELYEGPFGSNLVNLGSDDFDRWLDAERLRLRRVAELTLRRLVNESESRAQWGEMCLAATRLVQMTPYDEAAHHSLIKSLWLHGDAVSALEHFEVAVQLLRAETSGGPSTEFLELASKIKEAPSAGSPGIYSPDRVTPFVGRANEFAILLGATERARRDGAGVVLVHGEPGIGKSRLLDEFAPVATLGDLRALYGRCYPGEEDLPYGAVTPGIRTLVTEILSPPLDSAQLNRLGFLLPEYPQDRAAIDGVADPSVWRRRLFEEVVRLLRSALDDQPILWFLDDVHWMDDASASLLRYVLRRLREYPLLIVASTRSPRGMRNPDRPALAPPEIGMWIEDLLLEPLSDGAIREMLRHVQPDTACTEALALAEGLASGNPFWAIEILLAATASRDLSRAAGIWDLTEDERLRGILSIRFRGLSQEAVSILQAICILERNATPRLVAEVAQLSLDATAQRASELYTRGIVHDVNGRIECVNDLLRDYVYSQLTAFQRSSLHARAAAALESEPQTNPGLLARHFMLGDLADQAYAYAMTAVASASESAGHAEAASMAAIARKTAYDRESELAALRLQAESLMAAAQLGAARDRYTELGAMLSPAAPRELFPLKLKIAECCAELSEWERGRAVIDDLRREIADMPPQAEQIHSAGETLYLALKIAIRQNDSGLAREIVETVENLEGPANGSSSESQASLMACKAVHSMFFVSSAKALSILENAHSLLSGAQDLHSQFRSRIQLLRGMAALRCAQWEQGEAALSECLRAARSQGDVLLQTAILNNLACSALEQGHWDRMESLLAGAEGLQQGLEDPLDVSMPIALNRATALFYQGFPRESLAQFESARAIADSLGAFEFLPQITAWCGLLRLQLGDKRSAETCRAALSDIEITELAGAQERFQIAWLQVYLDSNQPEAKERLRAYADFLDPLDVSNALKVKWLGKILFGGAPESVLSSVEQELRAAGIGWFCRFSRRWLRATRARS